PAPATTPASPLSLHDALPISSVPRVNRAPEFIPHIRTVLVTDGGHGATYRCRVRLRCWHRSWLRHGLLYLRLLWCRWGRDNSREDRKSTRLNSSHVSSSYAGF